MPKSDEYRDYHVTGLQDPLTRADFERIQAMAQSNNTGMRVLHGQTTIFVHEESDLDQLVEDYGKIAGASTGSVLTAGPCLKS